MSNKTIDDLRAALFDAIEGVKNGTLDIEKAKCISELSQVMVNSAKVEVEHEKATGEMSSIFLNPIDNLPAGVTGIVRHRLAG
jgi:hypothetical protein